MKIYRTVTAHDGTIQKGFVRSSIVLWILQGASGLVCERLSAYKSQVVPEDTPDNDVLEYHICFYCVPRHRQNLFKCSLLRNTLHTISRHENMYCVGNERTGLVIVAISVMI